MINKIKKWIKSQKKAVAAQGGRLKTSGYTPINRQFWNVPRDLPPFNFEIIYYMLMDPEVRLALKTRSAPLYGTEFAYKESDPTNPKGFKWTPGIESSRPEVGVFIQRQIERIWRLNLHHILKAQIWGWAGGEMVFKLGDSKLIEVDRLEARHADDMRLLKSESTGDRIGLRIKRIKNSSQVDLQFPYAFFHSHDRDAGLDYGSSVLLGAYSPWSDKWLNGGALDVRRLFMHKDAYGGADLGYPDGETYIDGYEQPIPNRDVARQIVEQIQSGNTVVRPSARDGDGNEKWPFNRATVTSNPQHILDYPKNLDAEIRTGIGIPDGITDTDNSVGLGDTKEVAMQAFYASLDCWCVELLQDLTEQTFEPLVLLNWGKAIDFQITHKPYAEQAMERKQSNQGGDAMGMDPMQQDPMGGMFDDSMMDQQPPGLPAPGDESQPQMMSMIGRGVLDASKLVEAANAVLLGMEWDEEKHPRATDGKFSSKAGSGTGTGRGDPPDALRHKAVDRLKERGEKGKAFGGKLSMDQIWDEIDAMEAEEPEATESTQVEPESTEVDSKTEAFRKWKESIKPKNDPDRFIKERERKPKPNGTPENPINKHVYTVPTSSLKVDPERFQYKVTGIDKKGVTKELKGTTVWNPELGGVLLVWRDPDTNEDFVINGHHRHELASRVGAEELNVRYIDAPNAVEARARGALANIAEGRGSSIDAAKYLRDSGKDLEHLKKAGVSLSGKIALEAGILRDLGDKSFQALTEGFISESQAVAVAFNLKDHELQDKLFRKLEDKDWTKREIEQAAKKLANSGSYKKSGSDLFGDFEEETSTFDQEVEIEAYIANRLRREANDYRAVANERRAENVTGAGNVLNTEENQKRFEIANIMAKTFEREAYLKGPVSAAVKEMAVKLAEADRRSERQQIKADALSQVRSVLENLDVQEQIPEKQAGMFGEDYSPARFDKNEFQAATGEIPDYNPKENQSALFHGLQDDPGQGELFGNIDAGAGAQKKKPDVLKLGSQRNVR
jgi:hypothetical protein